MIWDCFNVANELELLKLRCEEVKPLNVQHVLVESPWTYQGKPKPLCFDQHKQDFSGYRIRHLICDAPPSNVPRKNEHRQRDYGTPLDMMDNDTVLICDVDEIPRAEAIRGWSGLVSRLDMRGNRYYLNRTPHEGVWNRAKICSGKFLRGKSASWVREQGWDHSIPNAGWHFSWMGGLERIFTKRDSLVEIEPGRESAEYWIGEINARPYLPLDDTYPKYLLDHRDEFAHMIHPVT